MGCRIEEEEMFLIMDVIPLMKVLKQCGGRCLTCNQQGQFELIMTCQCFRLFFIPIFKWHKTYILRHSCGGEAVMKEEVAMGILSGQVDISTLQFTHEQGKRIYKCSSCGKALEQAFEYCPYCGHKQ